MTFEQASILALLMVMLFLFIWGKWRYDLVSLMILLVASVMGLVPVNEAFSGFGHPAVITVAAVLVVSRGLMNSGIVDFMARLMNRVGEHYLIQLAALVGAVTLSSAFMNNIGALALFMPVAIRIARKSGRSPSLYLMPLAFGSLLGGVTTLVGTPPNIIISSFRADTLGIPPFRMFDFTLAGAGVAAVGVIFIILAARLLIPKGSGNDTQKELFEVGDYITALEVVETSKTEGVSLSDIEKVSEVNVRVIGHTFGKKKYPVPYLSRPFQKGDRIIVEGSADSLQEVMNHFGFVLAKSDKLSREDLKSEEITLIEAIVTTNSSLINRTARGLRLRSRFGANLLGVAREGARLKKFPEDIVMKAGDVLLLQGAVESLQEVLQQIGCLPLSERDLRIGKPKRLILGSSIFIAALIIAGLGILPVQIMFTASAVVMVLTRFLSLKEVYENIDWSIIVLLAAIIPVSQALETTGSAQLVADIILKLAFTVPLWMSLALVMGVTMLLSNVVNNAAATLIMAPIAVKIALGLSVSADPFLMGVAIASSSAFLTPIGHQSNTLVMGPGGYKFGDYWKLGLPLSIIVMSVGVPLILLFWGR